MDTGKILDNIVKDRIVITLVIESDEKYGPLCRGKLKQKKDENGNFVFGDDNGPILVADDAMTEKIETKQDFVDILKFSFVQNKINKFLNDKFRERVIKGESFYIGDVVKENIHFIVNSFLDAGFLPREILKPEDVANPENVITACTWVATTKDEIDKFRSKDDEQH